MRDYGNTCNVEDLDKFSSPEFHVSFWFCASYKVQQP